MSSPVKESKVEKVKKPRKMKEPRPEKVKQIREPGPRITRPPNAFMLYGMDNRKSLSEANESLSNTNISKLLGKQWKALPQEEKVRYRQEARGLNKMHQEMYPGLF